MKTIEWGLTVGVVLFLAGSGCLQAAEPAGVIKRVNGEVRIERGGKPLEATAGTRVMPSDRLVTGRDGSVGVSLRDDTLVSAGPNTSLEVEQFQFNSTTYEGSVVMRVLRGTMAMITGLIARANPQALTVRTPTATAGVRGTEFIVEVPE